MFGAFWVIGGTVTGGLGDALFGGGAAGSTVEPEAQEIIESTARGIAAQGVDYLRTALWTPRRARCWS